MNSKNSSLKTVLVISVGFALIYLFFGYTWSIYVSVSVSILGLFSDRLANTIHFIWMKLAKLLSYIVPNILLTLVFYLLLTPIAFLSKIFRKEDLLMLKNSRDSLWVESKNDVRKDSFNKMW